MSSSTRSRILVFLALVTAIVAYREREIRRHEADLDDWPRRTEL